MKIYLKANLQLSDKAAERMLFYKSEEERLAYKIKSELEEKIKSYRAMNRFKRLFHSYPETCWVMYWSLNDIRSEKSKWESICAALLDINSEYIEVSTLEYRELMGIDV